MAQFEVNTHRFDPYKNFKFRIKWDGKYVAGLSKMSVLKRSTKMIETGGRRPKRQSQVSWQDNYDAITLSRGITHDRI